MDGTAISGILPSSGVETCLASLYLPALYKAVMDRVGKLPEKEFITMGSFTHERLGELGAASWGDCFSGATPLGPEYA
jgi:hypothetical protein